MLLFAGSSNKHLAEKIAKNLGIALGNVDLEKFSDGEIRPWIAQDVRDKTVFVLQSFSQPMNDHIIEFILMGDAIRRGAPKRMIGIIPYFGYARQDKQHRHGEPVSARVMAKFIEVVPYHEIITIDLHNDAIVGFFRIPVIHKSALPAFAHALPAYIEGDGVVVSPDVGGVKRARNMASQLDFPLAVMEKRRNLDTKDFSETIQIIGNVSGKTAIIVDDIISTGATIANGAKALKEEGARKVIAIATHGIFTGHAFETLEKSPIDLVLTTDSISHKAFPSKKYGIVSIASGITDAIRIISGN
jgi:ribose-phosphate pyrophosphokinase